MSIFQSECFEDFLNDGIINVVNAGPLHEPILDFTVKRDSKLNIKITTTANHDATSNAEQHPAGTVRMNEDSIILKGLSGTKIIINGVQPHGYNISTDRKTGTQILTETSIAHSIEAKIQDSSKGKYLIEWLENVDDSYFHWPESTHKVVKEETKIIIGGKDESIILKSSDKSESFQRNCVHINNDEFELYLSTTLKKTNKQKVKPGFILYKGCPPEEVRKKVRNCLSFSLGRPLIYIGYSSFCKDWKLVSFKSINAYSIAGAAFNLHTMPPAPLGEKYQGEIDSKALSRLVNSLYTNYEMCNFGHVAWSYWHAVCAPIHIAAVHFGACIEALQKSYIENNGKNFKTALIDKSEWKKLRALALKIIPELNIGDMEKRVIENKINSLNQSPQSIVTERFLTSLNIELSDLELSAWQQRNNAAHGNEIEDNDHVRLIREIKVLKVIFHRVLLSIINGSDYYFDYYSIGFPVRTLTECIPNET